MHCLCKRKTYELKVECEFYADPIWCNQCGCNLDLYTMLISNELKSELMEWERNYNKWVDREDEYKLISNHIIEKIEEEHNKQGAKLTEKLKKELGGKYKILFSPSRMAKDYEDLFCRFDGSEL